MRVFISGKEWCPTRTMQMGRFNAPCHNALINSLERHDSVKINRKETEISENGPEII